MSIGKIIRVKERVSALNAFFGYGGLADYGLADYIMRVVDKAVAERLAVTAPAPAVAAEAPRGVELWVLCEVPRDYEGAPSEKHTDKEIVVCDNRLLGFPEGRGFGVDDESAKRAWRIVTPLDQVEPHGDFGKVAFRKGRVIAEGTLDEMRDHLKKRAGACGLVGMLVNGVAVRGKHPDVGGVEVAVRRGDAHSRTVVSASSADGGDHAVAVSPVRAKAGKDSVAIGSEYVEVGARSVAVATPAPRACDYACLRVGVAGVAIGSWDRCTTVYADAGSVVVMRGDGRVTTNGDDITVIVLKNGEKNIYPLCHGDELSITKGEVKVKAAKSKHKKK